LPAALAERVEWLDRWPEQVMCGVVLANEVLDAMPVERFVLRGPPV
jgi:SAM-dependent MidA family methyltransferase